MKKLALGILGVTLAITGCKREKKQSTIDFLKKKYAKESVIDSTKVSYLLKNNVPSDSILAYERALPISVLDSDYLQESVHKLYTRNLFPSIVKKYESRNLANLELCSRYNIGPDIDNNLPDGFWEVKERLYKHGLSDIDSLKNDYNRYEQIILELHGFMGIPSVYMGLLEKGKDPFENEKYVNLNIKYGSKITGRDIKYFEKNNIPFEKIENLAKNKELINKIFK